MDLCGKIRECFGEYVLIAGIAAATTITAGYLVLNSCKSEEEKISATNTPIATATLTITPTVTYMPLPTETSAPKYTNPITGLSCNNVISQAEIDALGAYDKLTLPFEPCTTYGEPVSEFKFNSPNIYLFPNEGTPILAPWDGRATVVEANETSANKGGMAIYIRNNSVSTKQPELRIYVSADPDNPPYGTFFRDLSGKDVKRGEAVGYVGEALPESLTSTSATMMLVFGINDVGYFNPFDTKFWAGGQICYFDK